jgi:hypothetical protein
MFDYPTIEAIAQYIGRQVLSIGVEAADTTERDRLNEAAAKLAEVSEEEAEALLLQRLESL